MGISLSTWGAITLFVSDLERSREFYGRAFGLPVIYEDENSAVFQFDGPLLNLLRETAADVLAAPVALGVVGGPRCQYTIFVTDVDQSCQTLASRGVTLNNGPLDRPWGMRTATFLDPDGTLWEIAQELESDDVG